MYLAPYMGRSLGMKLQVKLIGKYLYQLGSDDEGADSSILADLASMFPAVEYSELVTILRSHGGDLDATVDYLMALSLHTEIGGSTNVIHQGLEEAEDSSYGQFSDEIGGLPSVMSCNQTDSDADDEWEEGEEDAPVNHGGNAKEALPSSCEEAMLSMRGGSREGDGYVVAGCIMLPKQTDEKKSRVMDGEGVPVATSTLPQHHKQPRPHKKHSEFLLSDLFRHIAVMGYQPSWQHNTL